MEENNQQEDILDNPFYNFIVNKHQKLYARIEEMKYALCVPQKSSLNQASSFSNAFVCSFLTQYQYKQLHNHNNIPQQLFFLFHPFL